MKVSEGKAVQVSWGDQVAEIFGDWELLAEECVSDYQGSGHILAYRPLEGVVAELEWSYGSCESCDSWIGMPSRDVTKALRDSATFSTIEAALKAIQARSEKNWRGDITPFRAAAIEALTKLLAN